MTDVVVELAGRGCLGPTIPRSPIRAPSWTEQPLPSPTAVTWWRSQWAEYLGSAWRWSTQMDPSAGAVATFGGIDVGVFGDELAELDPRRGPELGASGPSAHAAFSVHEEGPSG